MCGDYLNTLCLLDFLTDHNHRGIRRETAGLHLGDLDIDGAITVNVFETMNWVRVSRGRAEWLAVVNTVTNLHVPQGMLAC
jgi:hypothetical protein